MPASHGRVGYTCFYIKTRCNGREARPLKPLRENVMGKKKNEGRVLNNAIAHTKINAIYSNGYYTNDPFDENKNNFFNLYKNHF